MNPRSKIAAFLQEKKKNGLNIPSNPSVMAQVAPLSPMAPAVIPVIKPQIPGIPKMGRFQGIKNKLGRM